MEVKRILNVKCETRETEDEQSFLAGTERHGIPLRHLLYVLSLSKWKVESSQ